VTALGPSGVGQYRSLASGETARVRDCPEILGGLAGAGAPGNAHAMMVRWREP
jgi:hypothetical protein